MTREDEFRRQTDHDMLVTMSVHVEQMHDVAIPEIKAIAIENDRRLTVIETTNTVKKEINVSNLLSSKGKQATVITGVTSGVGFAIYLIGQAFKWWG